MKRVLVALLLLTGCPGRKGEAPVPVSSAAPSGTSSGSSAAEAISAGAARDAVLAVGPDGQPVAAWVEAGKVEVRRREGSSWKPLGATGSGQNPRELAVSGLHLAWVEENKDRPVVVVKRFENDAWTSVGDPIGSEKVLASLPALAVTKEGPVVACLAMVGGARRVLLRRWNGKAWVGIGEELVSTAGTQTSKRPGLCVLATGEVVCAWIERVPQQPVQLCVRKSDPAWTKLEAMPAPAGADGDSQGPLLAAAGDSVWLALSYNAGLRHLQRWTGPGWSGVPLPRKELEGAGNTRGFALAAGGSGVAFAWATDFLELAVWEGSGWSAPVKMTSKRGVANEPVLAVSGSEVRVAWLEAQDAGGSKFVSAVAVGKH